MGLRNWFKSILGRDSEEKQQVKQEISNLNEKLEQVLDLLGKTLGTAKPEGVIKEEEILSRPYASLISVEDNVNIIFEDGEVLSKGGITKDVINKIIEAKSKQEIKGLLFHVPEKDSQLKEIMEFNDTEVEFDKDEYAVLSATGQFTVLGEGKVTFKNLHYALPNTILAEFIDIAEKTVIALGKGDTKQVEQLQEDFTRLKLFSLLLLTGFTENAQSNLLTFCRTNDVRISPNGNLILYRNVVAMDEPKKEKVKKPSATKVDASIIKLYEQIRRQKKGTKNYRVMLLTDRGEYVAVKDDKAPINSKTKKAYDPTLISIIGNLKDLYDEILARGKGENIEEVKEEQWFTSQRNKGVHKFRIGDVYKEDKSKINLNAGLCSEGGLHAASVNYDYSGFGDTSVVVLVNPSNCIVVPTSETGKLRTIEMKIACLNPNKIGVHINEALIAEADNEYGTYNIEQLEAKLSGRDVFEVKGKSPIADLKDISVITEMLKNRVKVVE